MKNTQISNIIKSKALELGFLNSAILPVKEVTEEKENLERWLNNEMHGEMGYMARNVKMRLNPELLFKNAKSIIIVLQNYFPEKTQTELNTPVISKYAFGTDYHFVMKEKLKKLLLFIQNEIQVCNGRPFVDSAPILERAWARRAGLGWIGKNSNLISVEHGSFFFIGELIVDIELPFDTPKFATDHCGNCTRCIDACPTKAIVANRVVDARKCVSYQTIELKGNLDEKLKGQFKNRVFGCDICQDVCPWNRFSKPTEESAFEPDQRLLDFSANEWQEITEDVFHEIFKKSAVKRTKYAGLKRNLDFLK